MKHLLLTLALGCVAFAQPPAGGPGFGPEGAGMGPGMEMGMGMGPGPGMFAAGAGPAASLDALKTYLALTDAQITQLKDLRKNNFDTNVKPVMDQIHTKQQALRALLQTSNPDSAAVGQLTVEIKALHEQIRSLRANLDKQAAALLTPDQQAKLADLQKAAALLPAIHQAMAVGLIAPPDPPAGGAAGMGMRTNRAAGRMAAR
jgi:protein CpxP